MPVLRVAVIGGGHSLNGGGSVTGLNFAVEWTPIEDRLELEAGTSLVFARAARGTDRAVTPVPGSSADPGCRWGGSTRAGS